MLVEVRVAHEPAVRKKRRERDEVFGAEACTARTWWMVIDPALPGSPVTKFPRVAVQAPPAW